MFDHIKLVNNINAVVDLPSEASKILAYSLAYYASVVTPIDIILQNAGKAESAELASIRVLSSIFNRVNEALPVKLDMVTDAYKKFYKTREFAVRGNAFGNMTCNEAGFLGGMFGGSSFFSLEDAQFLSKYRSIITATANAFFSANIQQVLRAEQQAAIV